MALTLHGPWLGAAVGLLCGNLLNSVWKVGVGFARIVALSDRAPTLHQIH
jgi:hypothetical protein